jgi:hypothetical protein
MAIDFQLLRKDGIDIVSRYCSSPRDTSLCRRLARSRAERDNLPPSKPRSAISKKPIIRLLHIKAISGLIRGVILVEVLQDTADLASCPDCDRLKSIELSVIPVHFR